MRWYWLFSKHPLLLLYVIQPFLPLHSLLNNKKTFVWLCYCVRLYHEPKLEVPLLKESCLLSSPSYSHLRFLLHLLRNKFQRSVFIWMLSSSLFYLLRNIFQRSVFIWMLSSSLVYMQLWWSCLWLSGSLSLFWTSASPPLSLFLLLLHPNQEKQPGKSHSADQENLAILLIAHYLGKLLLSVGWVGYISLYDTSCITQWADDFDWLFCYQVIQKLMNLRERLDQKTFF